METLEPVFELKHKYTCPKTRGGYSSKSTGGNGLKKRRKNGSKVPVTRKRVMILTAGGKVAWDWQAV